MMIKGIIFFIFILICILLLWYDDNHGAFV